MGKYAVILRRIGELIETGHVNRFRHIGPIKCPVSAVPYFGERSEETIRTRYALVVAEFWFKPFRQLTTVNLFDIEHGIAFSEETARRLLIVVFARLLFVGAPVDYWRTMFTSSDLCAKLSPLSVGSP